MEEDDQLLIYFDGEEHLVRRLGAAVVACWDEIPNALQMVLLDQAKRVLDEHQTDRLDQQIQGLLFAQSLR